VANQWASVVDTPTDGPDDAFMPAIILIPACADNYIREWQTRFFSG
jgi:hypothetical protein